MQRESWGKRRQESVGIVPLGQDLFIPEDGPTPLATLEWTFR